MVMIIAKLAWFSGGEANQLSTAQLLHITPTMPETLLVLCTISRARRRPRWRRRLIRFSIRPSTHSTASRAGMPKRMPQCRSAAPAQAAVGVVASSIIYITVDWVSTRLARSTVNSSRIASGIGGIRRWRRLVIIPLILHGLQRGRKSRVNEVRRGSLPANHKKMSHLSGR